MFFFFNQLQDVEVGARVFKPIAVSDMWHKFLNQSQNVVDGRKFLNQSQSVIDGARC